MMQIIMIAIAVKAYLLRYSFPFFNLCIATMVFRPNYQNVVRRGIQDSYSYPTNAYCNTSIVMRIPLQPIL